MPLRQFAKAADSKAKPAAAAPAKPAAPAAAAKPAAKADSKDKSKKKGAKADEASTSQEPQVKMDFLKIFKEQEGPKELPKSEYPDWLWTIHHPLPSIMEMDKIGFDNLSEKLQKRYIVLQRRLKIKRQNTMSKLKIG